ncbi:MAG: DUF4180 domain-containing protein [Caulobacterales bacterium]
MTGALHDIGGAQVLVCAPDGSAIARVSDALDLVGEAFACGAEWVALPAARLDPAFFDLKTGLAGEITQKFVNYQVRLAIVGDIGAFVRASKPLADYVRESNRTRRHIVFADDMDAFAHLLSTQRA